MWDESNSSGECVVLPVPSHMISRVIGKKGSTIKHLMEISGAFVKVKPDENGIEKIFIRGNEDSRNTASEWIKNKMEEWESLPNTHNDRPRNNDRWQNTHSQNSGWRNGRNNEWSRSKPSRQDNSPQKDNASWSSNKRSYDDRDDSWDSSPTDDRRHSTNVQGNSYRDKIPHSQDDDWGSSSYDSSSKRHDSTNTSWGSKPKKYNDNYSHNHYSNSRNNTSNSSSYNQYKSSTDRYQSVPARNSSIASKPPIDWAVVRKAQDDAIAQRMAELPPIQKNFYQEHAEITALSPETIESIRSKNNNIMVKRDNASLPIPNPIVHFYHAFENFPDVLRMLKSVGFTSPTPIQVQSWPVLLQGLDLIGIAQTGTGKTLAFLLPAIIHVTHQRDQSMRKIGPMVLVLAPTRELAAQIESEARKYQYRDIKSVCVMGGVSKSEQVNMIKGHVDIVIATPGRLNDLKQSNAINLDNVSYVVLDEADRMLDMGFEPQIRKSFIGTRPDRQTVMTTATWPTDAERIAKSFMTDPVHVIVGSLDLTACHSVEQEICVIEESEKFDALVSFLQSNKSLKVIVFMRKKAHVEHYASELVRMGIDCESIHGGYDQSARDDSLHYFKTGVTNILIATDLASRGLDVRDIDVVFNYDFPENLEEYVHRIGRTGRAGRTGKSITLFTWSNRYHCKELMRIMEEANQRIPHELIRMDQRTKPRDKPERRRFN